MSILHTLRRFTPKPLVRFHDWAYYQYVKAFPRLQAERIYREYLGRDIDWDKPTEFNEKGRWIQFRTDTSLWPLLADKLRVREWIAEQGLGDCLPKLYGHWESAAAIDFDALPRQFVIKTNNGCGDVVVVRDKAKADLAAIRRAMDKALKERYGVMTAEPHYLRIPPRIMAEELLPTTCPASSSMVDYKLICSFGQPMLWDVCYDRGAESHHCIQTWYSPRWQKRDDWHTGAYVKKDIPAPASLDRMYDIAWRIARDLPIARIDFYDVAGRPYLGEITLTPCGFNGDELTSEAQMALGAMVDLDRIPKSQLL